LENATDRKASNDKKIRRRRIQRVIVESTSDDEAQADIETDSDTEWSENDERPVHRIANKVPAPPTYLTFRIYQFKHGCTPLASLNFMH